MSERARVRDEDDQRRPAPRCFACLAHVWWREIDGVMRAVAPEPSPYGDVMVQGDAARIVPAHEEVDDEEPLYLLHADICAGYP